MLRILIAGLMHETNTFARSKAGYESFVSGGTVPAMARGTEVLAFREVNISIGGFILGMENPNYELVPVIWAGATPSGRVTVEAFEAIAGEILAAAKSHRFDGVYLDLHGAMVCEHVDDGEGELLERMRQIVGSAVPIVASLDLHANVTTRMLKNADALIAYRTYPHEDMSETGRRAAQLMKHFLHGDYALHLAYRRLPFLIPINAMCTSLDPAGSVYRKLLDIETSTRAVMSFAPGFPAADFSECGGVIWGYGEDATTIEHAVDSLTQNIVSREAEWAVRLMAPEAAVREAQRIGLRATRPILIADTQDNPGAGGSSDTMGMLRALVNCRAECAAIGMIADAAAAQVAHAVGIGHDITLELGGRSGIPGDSPFMGTFRVEQLSNGQCRFDGPMMNGKQANLGPSARLSIAGIQIAVSSHIDQMIDRNLYRMVGIEPQQFKILVNKSSVHFRADFQPIAEAILIAKAPGAMAADPGELPWTKLASGMRVAPMGRVFGLHDPEKQ